MGGKIMRLRWRSLRYTNDAADPTVTFSGAQAPSKKTECVLIYDPVTGTFTLEKLLSTFTFNLTSAGANQHSPLTLPKPKAGSDDDTSEESSSDGDATKADRENPFDYRHFINNKFEVPTTSSRLRDDKNRKERLDKLQQELEDPNASQAEEEEEEEEEDNGEIIVEDPSMAPTPLKQTLPARPKSQPSKPRAKPAPKATPAKKSAAAAGGPVSLSSVTSAAPKGSPSISLAQPSPPRSQTGNKRPREEESSSESDADDESEEDEDEEEEALGFGELIVEGEDDDNGRNNRSRSTTAGLGPSWMGDTRGGPISLSWRGGRADTNMDAEGSDEDDDDAAPTTNGPHHSPYMNGVNGGTYQQPVSLSGLSDRRRNLDEEETSDEDEDEEPQRFVQQLEQALPQQQEEEESEEEEEDYDLESMVRGALENEDEIPDRPMQMQVEEESSSEEE
ncbi:hypothetical protein BDZ91DRAFT_495218 [Kalaharituber pfeilii]|nr:hypothetical protein BDZ91DRAFT_495218 [Kalaharituber pfeilii]